MQEKVLKRLIENLKKSSHPFLTLLHQKFCFREKHGEKKLRGGLGMNVACLKEIKNNENRVALTPAGAKELVKKGHKVVIQKGAGLGSNFSDKEYQNAGARIENNPKKIAGNAELILKVKEPLENEYNYFNENSIVFTYLHYASNKPLAQAMLKNKSTSVAYETVINNGRTVLLDPMSRVAGQMAVLMGACHLAKFAKGKGRLVSNILGVTPSRVAIIGGGTVGENALMNSLGLRAETILFERSPEKKKELMKKYGSNKNFKIMDSNEKNLMEVLPTTDLLIGAVYVVGAKAPHIITRKMLRAMPENSIFVDVSIDQGGISETSKATTHDNPVYKKEGVWHYCVANMPGAYPETSTIALTNATLPYVLKLADDGLLALKKDKGFLNGLSTRKGFMTNKSVADLFKIPFMEAEKALEL